MAPLSPLECLPLAFADLRETLGQVGGWPTPLKNMSSSVGMIIPYIRRPLQGGGRQRSRDIANLGGSLFRRFWSLWGLTEVLQVLHPYLHAFLRWRLASWLWGSLFRRFCSLWGLTVSLSSLYLPYLHAFLRWRLASWLWGSLFRRFCSFCSLWGLTVSLSSLYIFPILLHSLGDVWHPGSGVPYLTAFLRWRFASWLWGSLFRRFCSFCSLWGLTVSLSSLYIFPIFMHSLGDVWHPGSGVPCFGGFAAFAAFGGSQFHFLPYIFPIFMHSLGDVWHPGSGVPCFGGFAAFAAFGGSQSHFLPYISSLS